jgi:LmbE family N-acetylglucosaminyl deacetylase
MDLFAKLKFITHELQRWEPIFGANGMKEDFKILAIGAHPDDIELGCGGSLAKLASQGALISAVVFSKGRRGTLSDADRSAETLRALGTIGVRDVHVYDFEDTKLHKDLTSLIEVVEEQVKQIEPVRVYTMFQEDRHQDHRSVFEASIIACRSVQQVLSYETPSSYPNFRPTVYEQISQELETKVRALLCHTSQGDRLYMQEDKIRAAAHFRGAQVDLGPSEGFIPYKMVL